MIVISKANKESRAQESGEECFNLQLLRKKSKEQKGESRPPLSATVALSRIAHATSSKAATTHPFCIGDSETWPPSPLTPPCCCCCCY